MRRPWRRGRAREGARRSGGSASDLLSMVIAGADCFGFAADALVCPVAIAPVRTGHVFGDGGRAVRSQAAAVAGDALAAVENLDCCRGDPRLDLLADQLVRHAVVMLGELDVVIEVDA